MIASDWVEGLVVVGDQGALVSRTDLPVPPAPGGQRQQPLRHPDPDPGQGAAAVLLQPELTLEGLDGALDPLPEAAQRAVPAWLVSAVGSQQPGAIAGDELVELAAGEALVGQDDQPRPQPGALVVQQRRHDLPVAQLRAGQAPSDRQPLPGGQPYSGKPQK
jgi:hypothetical protein